MTAALFVMWLFPNGVYRFISMPKPPWYGAEAPAYTERQAYWYKDLRCRGCSRRVKVNRIWDVDCSTEKVDDPKDTSKYYFCWECTKDKGLEREFKK